MSTIDASLIKPDVDNPRNGLYLNPRQTIGWNDQLLEIIKNATAIELKTFLHQYLNDTDIPKNMTIKNLKAALKLKISIYGIGKTAKQAVDNATKNLNADFKKLMLGQYSNATAFKWTYLNPQYLDIIKTHIGTQQIIILTDKP